MSSWNYRIVKKDDTFTIHECYYYKGGKPNLISVDPICSLGESLAELKEDYEAMAGAFKLPVLNYEDFVSRLTDPKCTNCHKNDAGGLSDWCLTCLWNE